MNFRTEIKPISRAGLLHHNKSIVNIGSCFAIEMAERLKRSGFELGRESHGILFHPLAMKRALEQVIEEYVFSEKDLIENNGLWHSLSHHGIYSQDDKKVTLDHLNTSSIQNAIAIRKAKIAIITFGTAWAWRYKTTGEIVGNCHKLPSALFSKELISHDEIINSWQSLFDRIKIINPDLEWILSVSPVRHWRDGAVENQVSKSHLLLAASDLEKNNGHVHYFPAYELMMDDLRDYRFYENDMLHPNSVAIDYIAEKFFDWSMTESTKSIAKEIGSLQRIFSHRPLHSASALQEQQEEATKKIEALIKKAKGSIHLTRKAIE